VRLEPRADGGVRHLAECRRVLRSCRGAEVSGHRILTERAAHCERASHGSGLGQARPHSLGPVSHERLIGFVTLHPRLAVREPSALRDRLHPRRSAASAPASRRPREKKKKNKNSNSCAASGPRCRAIANRRPVTGLLRLPPGPRPYAFSVRLSGRAAIPVPRRRRRKPATFASTIRPLMSTIPWAGRMPFRLEVGVHSRASIRRR